MELEITDKILLASFAIAFVLGAIANRTNFCTMGAVSDWVNMGDKGRIGAWFFAIAVAIAGVLALEAADLVDVGSSRPPYRGSLFDWSRYILGGLMFGVGMTFASGCGNKNLIRLGGGNIKSVFVVAVAGAMAYLMNKTDFYGTVFYSWQQPIAIDLAKRGYESQEIGALVAGTAGMESSGTAHLVLGGLITLVILFFLFRNADFRTSISNIIGGLTVGLAVLGGWYLTGGPWGRAWMEAVDFMDTPPVNVGVQSYTFISPMGETLTWLAQPTNIKLVSFGVAALLGVIAGSFVYALISRSFRFEWFASIGDFVRHMIGAVLMGIGGVLALGCTIGQGVTGVSTLSLGSFMALGSIILGSALTMKVQYYKMVYEKEASFMAALVTGLVDLRLLPKGMRRLEDV